MEILFVYNPESGRGKIKNKITYIKEYIKKRNHNITIKATTKQTDAYNYAKNCNGYDLMLVAGGDGTLNEVVNGLMELEKKPLLGYIPTGTVNDVAHLIGIPKKVKKALDIIFEDDFKKKIDITKINDKYFVYTSATGKFAKASYDIKRQLKRKYGVFAYLYRGSQEIFRDYNMAADIKYDQGRFRGPYSLLLFLNGPRVGGYRLHSLKSKLDDGLIEARFFKREPGMLMRFLSFFLSGGLYNTKKNKTISSTKFIVEIDNNSEWNIDGEFAFRGCANLEVINRAITIFVNPKKKKLFVK